jgi:hypothetical protein
MRFARTYCHGQFTLLVRAVARHLDTVLCDRIEDRALRIVNGLLLFFLGEQ